MRGWLVVFALIILVLILSVINFEGKKLIENEILKSERKQCVDSDSF